MKEPREHEVQKDSITFPVQSNETLMPALYQVQGAERLFDECGVAGLQF
jgi:hypothetical protein